MNAAMQSRLGLAVVCLGASVGPFDATVNTAFPVITAAFGWPRHEIQWVVIAFVLAQSSLTLVFGRLGDLFGYHRDRAAGLRARACRGRAHAPFSDPGGDAVFQGLAVGLVGPAGPGNPDVGAHEKREVIAIFVAATSVAMALGPWLGGLLIDAFGWPGVYWFRVPLALLALLLILPAPPAVAGDLAGGKAAAPARRPLRLGRRYRPDRGDVPPDSRLGGRLARPQGEASRGALGLLAGGVVGAALFVRHELRTAHPVLRITPFRSPRFAGVSWPR